MWAMLLLRACLDLNDPSSCNVVPVPQFPQLTFVGCQVQGMTVAMDWMKQDPTYGRPQWHFGGWRCQPSDKRQLTT